MIDWINTAPPWAGILVLIGIPVLAGILIDRLAKRLSPWRADPRTPWRRYCKQCGTGQSYWVPGGWQTFLPVRRCGRKH